MGSETSTPRLDDRTFRHFLHDVHHTYLLLHRAFQQIPPAMIPNLEPMPLPCLDELNQPEPLIPVTIPSPDLSPTASELRVPSDNEEEDNELFRTVADQDLPHRAASTKVPPPVRHLMAPAPSDLPLPSTGLSKSPQSSLPDLPRRRRRSTEPKIDKTPAARRSSRSRSRSLMSAPRPWASDEVQKLKELKGNNKAKHSWKVIAGKLARSERDCKLKWRLVNGKQV